MYRIVNEEPPRLDDSHPMAALVTSMMQHDPDVRPSMAAVEQTAAALPRRTVAPPLDLESTQGFAAFDDSQQVPAAAPTVAAPPSATTAFRPLAPPVTEAVPEPASSASAPHNVK
jgi:hypothetical protein